MAGFGSATVLTPVAGFFMDMKVAIGVVAFFHLFGNLARVRLFRGNVDMGLFWRFGLPSIAMSFAGAWLTAAVSSLLLRGVFGGFLVLYVLLSLFAPALRLKPTTGTSVAGGLASGFVAGLIGTGGALRAAFLTSFHLEKERYIATSAAIALVVDVTRIPVYIAGGTLVGRDAWILVAVLIPVAFAGARLGKAAVGRLPHEAFRRFVLGALFLAGLKLIYDAVAR